MEESKETLKRYLKVILYQLAARCDNPGSELQEILHEVISELHGEVKENLEAAESKRRLRLVSPSDTGAG